MPPKPRASSPPGGDKPRNTVALSAGGDKTLGKGPKDSRKITAAGGGASPGGGKGKGKGRQKPVVQVDFDLEPARPEDPQRALREIETLEKIDASSQSRAAQQVIEILSPAASGEEKDVVRACCLALLRLMQGQKGLLAVLNASTMECLHAIKETILPEDEGPAVFEMEVQVVRDEASKKAAAFLEKVDHVDFHELPTVLLLIGKLHRDSELVCRKGFSTLMRFASYDAAHRQEMLNGGLVPVLSSVLKNCLEPELLRQSLTFLTRLSAPPFGEEAAALVMGEAELLATVVSVLEDRPTDIGLQLNGFRLLTVWARASIELRQEVMSSAAPDLLRSTYQMLSDAGLDHIASWLWAIAGRTVVDDSNEISIEPDPADGQGRKLSKNNRKSVVGQPPQKSTK